MKPRSRAPSRHSSLISLSSSISAALASVSAISSKAWSLPTRLTAARTAFISPPVEAEVAAVEDRLVAQVERVHAALAVDRGVVLADGEEGDPPALLGAEGEELVEDPPVSSGGPIGSAATIA